MINQPQVAILGVGTVDKTPVVIDDAIAIRSICHLSLTLRPSPDRRRAGRSVHDQGEGGAARTGPKKRCRQSLASQVRRPARLRFWRVHRRRGRLRIRSRRSPPPRSATPSAFSAPPGTRRPPRASTSSRSRSPRRRPSSAAPPSRAKPSPSSTTAPPIAPAKPSPTSQPGKLASWKEIPGAQPPIGDDDSGMADRIVRADPRWSAALRARRVNPAEAFTVSWPAGYFGLPGEDGSRVVRVTPYLGSAGSNYHAHPVEGVAAFVDLTNRKILDFIDIDRNAPVTRHNEDFDAESVRPLRPAAPPIQVTTPQGPGYRIEDGEVRWEKWRFRFALHPREGLVLYTVGYEDGGRTRSVLYRASLSEMAVPYGDPGRAWFFRNTFDAGELGLGILATSLRPGVDCPQNCQVFPATVASESGQPHEIPGAVGLYERETSIAWKHGQETRPARDLVLFYSSQAGNYEYGFQYIFHQDGALEVKALLTGIMSVIGRRCDCPNRAPQPVQSLAPPAPGDTVPPRLRLGRPPLCSGGATPDHTRRCPAPA